MQSFVTQDPMAMTFVKTAFSSFNGKSVTIYSCDPETKHNLASYWDGGYRDYFCLLQLSTGKHVDLPPQSAFDRTIAGIDTVQLPRGVILVTHHFAGARKHASITVRADDLNDKFLPSATPELSENEKKVLFCTRCYKSSYGGDSEYRRHESGLSAELWNTAKESLQSKNLLDKRGALTINGRNIANNLRY